MVLNPVGPRGSQATPAKGDQVTSCKANFLKRVFEFWTDLAQRGAAFFGGHGDPAISVNTLVSASDDLAQQNGIQTTARPTHIRELLDHPIFLTRQCAGCFAQGLAPHA